MNHVSTWWLQGWMLRHCKALAGALLALFAALLAPAACADDRPFLATTSAAAEEDDDQVWSIETTWQRLGAARGVSVAVEYAFNPTTSLQLELERDRADGSTLRGASLEFKHLFNHIARDGFGWGIDAELLFERAAAQGWRRVGVALTAPLTFQIMQGAALLHVNAGVFKPSGAPREWMRSVAIQGEAWRRTVLFAEAAAQGEQRLLHAGVRWWIQREKLALDVSVQRVREGGQRESGVVLGLAWYDLSW